MEPISNVDRLVLVLRRRLEARTRSSASPKTDRTGRDEDSGLDAVGKTQKLAEAAEVDDRVLRRALVQNILTEHFGSAVLNEPRFQLVVDKVVEAISEDDAGAQLLAQLTQELRRGI